MQYNNIYNRKQQETSSQLIDRHQPVLVDHQSAGLTVSFIIEDHFDDLISLVQNIIANQAAIKLNVNNI